jgi:glutathione peroxidase
VKWNFEKFLVSPQGDVVARFDPTVKPDDAQVISAIESNLPS